MRLGGCGLDSLGSGYGPVLKSCKNGIELQIIRDVTYNLFATDLYHPDTIINFTYCNNKRFLIKNGLNQGDALSQLLFNVVLVYAIRRVRANKEGLKLNGTHQNVTEHTVATGKVATVCSVTF